MAVDQKAWKSFEDAFRAILDTHKEFFGLESVELSPGTAVSESGYVYDIEVVGYSKGDEKQVLFECRRKTRNLEPGDAGELAYRIITTGAKKGYFVTTLEKGLSAGAKMLADHAEIGHIQLSGNATPHVYVMKYLRHFFAGAEDFVGASDYARVEIIKEKDID